MAIKYRISAMETIYSTSTLSVSTTRYEKVDVPNETAVMVADLNVPNLRESSLLNPAASLAAPCCSSYS